MPSPTLVDNVLAISCINVGVGPGGTTNLVARVAIVDYRGDTVFHKYVKPTAVVTDYRTQTTGITAQHLNDKEAWDFTALQHHLAKRFQGKILVGHSLWNDLSVLGLPHAAVDTRDVALYQEFSAISAPKRRPPNTHVADDAKKNSRGADQPGKLSCIRTLSDMKVENARAALDLYRSDRDSWESAISCNNWPCALPPSTFSRCYT